MCLSNFFINIFHHFAPTFGKLGLFQLNIIGKNINKFALAVMQNRFADAITFIHADAMQSIAHNNTFFSDKLIFIIFKSARTQ